MRSRFFHKLSVPAVSRRQAVALAGQIEIGGDGTVRVVDPVHHQPRQRLGDFEREQALKLL